VSVRISAGSRFKWFRAVFSRIPRVSLRALIGTRTPGLIPLVIKSGIHDVSPYGPLRSVTEIDLLLYM
jgi:hypothetical protein